MAACMRSLSRKCHPRINNLTTLQFLRSHDTTTHLAQLLTCQSLTNTSSRMFSFGALYRNEFKESLSKSNSKGKEEGPSFEDFISNINAGGFTGKRKTESERVPYVHKSVYSGRGRKVYFETYGCQMNVNDTEIASSILQQNHFQRVSNISEADVILLVTCSIREGAESKIWKRLRHLKTIRKRRSRTDKSYPLKIGILGCMAERLKSSLLEEDQLVDIVCGPDAYKDLPRLLAITSSGQAAINVQLSLDETYADVMPVRLAEGSPTAFVSIMRGCDNMCTYCIVPFTRGRERSRPVSSILKEVRHLSDQGIKEVTLLGQNVNSYRDMSEKVYHGTPNNARPGFKTVYKSKVGGLGFGDLLDKVSRIDPEMRIRFTSPHPKDFPDEVLDLIKERPNICKQIHIPAQSGNDQVLESMRRGYTRETYLTLVNQIKQKIPDVALSSDFIAGFCGETESAHEESLSLIREVQYNFAYCFPYSMREKTRASHRLVDDVPEVVKSRRHMELIQEFRLGSEKLNQSYIGQQQLVLIEGESKKSVQDLAGRNDGNTKVIIPNAEVPWFGTPHTLHNLRPGDYVVVQISSASSQTLKGIPLYQTTLQEFHRQQTQPWFNTDIYDSEQCLMPL